VVEDGATLKIADRPLPPDQLLTLYLKRPCFPRPHRDQGHPNQPRHLGLRQSHRLSELPAGILVHRLRAYDEDRFVGCTGRYTGKNKPEGSVMRGRPIPFGR
jgi:hypothetical protein